MCLGGLALCGSQVTVGRGGVGNENVVAARSVEDKLGRKSKRKNQGWRVSRAGEGDYRISWAPELVERSFLVSVFPGYWHQ